MDQKLFKKAGTIILTTNEDRIDENFCYATGISKTKHVSATAIVNKSGTTVLTNRLEHGLFRGKKIIIEKKEQYEKIMKSLNGTIGMNLSYISANSMKRYRKLVKGKIVDVSKEFEEMRAIKSASEIKKIKEACKITTDVLDGVDKILGKTRTEKELVLELEYAARKNGAEGIAFPTIVASGANAALPHHSPTNQKISGLLLIDYGVVYDGYCSDITRTFFIGKADAKTKHVYDTVHRAQQAGIAKMRNGLKSKNVHNAASFLIKKELKQELIHSFGHGLGIETHDYPEAAGPKSSVILRANMVMTAEPGYYEKNWGGVRIEDDIVIGNIPRPITKAPSSLLEL